MLVCELCQWLTFQKISPHVISYIMQSVHSISFCMSESEEVIIDNVHKMEELPYILIEDHIL